MSASLPLLMLDHDGVVVDSLDVFCTSLIEACRQLGIGGVAAPEDVVALFAGNFYECLRAAGADEAQISEAMRRTARALRNALPWLRPFPLMPEVLAELAEARHLVIVTSNNGDLVKAFLRRHRIAGVAEVAGAEAGHSKTAKIETLLARFPGQETYWFVGDTAGDMREARRAGATPVGVAWGWHDPELLEAAGAERIAASPADLLAIVAADLAADFMGMG
jgi:phosphoglycolate phosphatase